MNRHKLSTACVAALVLLAGTATLADAATETHTQTVQTTTPFAAQEDGENATESVNVTVETLRLQNVRLNDAFFDHVHVTGNVTAANGTAVVATENGSKTVENITAGRLFVLDATLQNVRFTNLTIRNDSVAAALFGEDGPPTGQNNTIETATLQNLTITNMVIRHGTVDTAQLQTVRIQEQSEITVPETRPEEPAVEAHSVTVGDATLQQMEAADLSIENGTAGNETTEGGGEN